MYGYNTFTEYITGFLIEKSLAADNLLIISLIFSHFKVLDKDRDKILVYGILGVLVLRGVMIWAGSELVARFHFVMYIFGIFLILSGIAILWKRVSDTESHRGGIIAYFLRHTKVREVEKNGRFIVRRDGKYRGTNLLMALISVELLDLIFAVDSIPAVFAITDDPYIVYTSNIFAVLGLRALYFSIQWVTEKFIYMKQAIGVLLVFTGSNIFFAEILPEFMTEETSLIGTIFIILCGIVFSLVKKVRHE